MKIGAWIVLAFLALLIAILVATQRSRPAAPTAPPAPAAPAMPPAAPPVPAAVHSPAGTQAMATVQALASSTPKGLAVSRDGSTVLAACDSAVGATNTPAGLYVSRDFGATWTVTALPKRWRGAALSADGRYMAASAAGNEGVWTSSDSGRTWAKTHTNSSWALAMAADGATLVSGGDPGPLDLSSDHGRTWRTAKNEARAWTGVALSGDAKQIVAAAWDQGKADAGEPQDLLPLYLSRDGGETWSPSATPRAWTAVCMSADGTRLAGVDGTKTLLLSEDGGVTWTPVEQGNGNARRLAMSADGRVMAAGAEGGSMVISFSTDHGRTWQTFPFSKPLFSLGISGDGSQVYCGYLHAYRLTLGQ